MAKNGRTQYELELVHAPIVSWWRAVDGEKYSFLFAPLNGANLSTHAARSQVHREGMRPGVSDLILHPHGHDAIYIECKTDDVYRPDVNKRTGKVYQKKIVSRGTQQDNQIEFQQKCEKLGKKYYIVHSLDEFMEIYNKYVKRK